MPLRSYTGRSQREVAPNAGGNRAAEDAVPLGGEVDAVVRKEPLTDDTESHRTAFWLRDGRHLLKAGMAPTTELLLTIGEPDEDVVAWLDRPPVVRADLAWLNDSAVMSPIAPRGVGRLPQYERVMDTAADAWLADREHARQYGLLNYGDWCQHEWSWGNNEYDSPFAFYVEFLRGGDPRWWPIAADAARHLADVVTINASADPRQMGAQYVHMPGHAGGCLRPYFHRKMGSSSNAPSHTWVEGSVLHYLLTGDENQRESLEPTARWLIGAGFKGAAGGIHHYDFGNCRECGWHLIHLTALARVSAEPRYRNAAALIVDRVLERQEPRGGWERQLKESHCGCPPPRERGEAGFMVGVLLSGLRRYHELTGDERVAAAIVGGARWLIEQTYDRGSRQFRYTSCPVRGSGPSDEYTRQVIDGLAYASTLTEDRELRESGRSGRGCAGVDRGRARRVRRLADGRRPPQLRALHAHRAGLPPAMSGERRARTRHRVVRAGDRQLHRSQPFAPARVICSYQGSGGCAGYPSPTCRPVPPGDRVRRWPSSGANAPV